jgi:hypothetical protein
MTKISTYVVDDKVTALDKWIGSDANMQNKTKNFTPKKLAAYFNENQVINIGTPLQYKYYTLDPLEARPNGTLTFETEIGPTVNFSSVTSFILSKYTTKQNIVSDFLNFLDGSKVLLFKSSDINSFGFYRISDIAIYDEDPNFFVVTVDYETGNGFMQEDEDYMISLVSLAGDFIPTKTSELINDGDDGVNPFISELDINRTEWDEAYEGKINSAEVTGDTTKTLTLTKQDGSTIEASWTDKGLDLELTTDGTSGEATLIGSVLNIPDYTIDTSEFVHIFGDEFVYDVKKFFQTDAVVSQLRFDNSRATGSQPSIYMANTEGSNSIFVTNQGSGTGIGISNTDDGYGQVITNDSIGVGLLVNNNGSGTSGLGGGIKIIGSSYAPSLTISNSAQGDSIFINSIGTSAGIPINLQQDGVTNFQVSKLGDVTANKFIKSGGTSVQYLMADGTVSTGPILTGFVPYIGATANVVLGEYGLGAGYVTFDTTPTNTPTDQGTMYWDDAKSTVSLIMNGTIQHIGQDSFYYAKNNSGSSIPKGTAVRFAGTDGASGHILIAPMIANGTVPSSYYMGITSETIANGAFGQVMAFGELEGVNTSAYTAGSLLYVSTTVAGGFQTTVPVAPNNIILAAATLNSKNNGALIVRATLGSNINNDEGVKIVSPNTGDLLQLQSNGLWENKSVASLGLVPQSRTLTINGTAFDLSADRSWNVGTVTSVGLSSTTGGITIGSTPVTTNGTITVNIATASGSQQGLLSSTDWNTFNNKQAAGNYITSLTGEATASGPGAAAVTLNNASVTGKLLTGVNITGGTVLATDSMLTAFGKLQNQINSLIGGSIYQGVWDANTNTPTLTSSVGTDGYYYIVNVAGSTNLNGITDWKIGDWAIFHGGTWQKVDNTESVSSVNGQTGAVSLTTDNISEGITNKYFLNSRARAALSFAAGSGAYNSTTGVITIPTNNNQITNGSNFITLASLSGSAPIQYNNTTGAISITQAGASSNGFLSSTDWNTFNNKQAAGNYVTIDTTQTITGIKVFNDFRLQLAAAGTSQPTVFQNSNSISVGSGGYNTLGFNSNSDLFFNDGTSNVAVLSFSNTTTRTYTLPNASGTLALTSDIPSVSGTTNYVSKFTGASTLGNSQIFDNGTNVGIGTTSPTNKLTVRGNLEVQSNGSVVEVNYLRIGTHPNGNWGGYVASESFYNSFLDSDLRLGVSNGGTALEALRIVPSGNVGIGTTSPLQKFDVDGLSYLRNDVYMQTNKGIFFSGNGAYGAGVYGVNSGNDLAVNAGGNEKMRITSSGNVLIGTTTNSESAKLKISGGYVYLKETSGADVYFRSAYDGNKAAIQVASANDLVLVTNNTSRMTLFANGNFAMVDNTATDAGYKLDVNGTIRSSQSITIGTGGAYTAGSIYSDSNWGMIFRARQASPTNAQFMWADSLDNELMRIKNGNVGIGTTSPAQKLDVFGTSRISSTTPTQEFFSTVNGDIWGSVYSQASGTGTGASLVFSTKRDGNSATDKMIITQNGNVGIGVTPSSDIWSSFKGIQINSWGGGIFSGSAVTNFVHNNYFDGTNIKYFRNGTAALYQQNGNIHSWFNAPSGTAGNAISFTQAMTLGANGNLLLGTSTDAGFRLDVNGTGRFSGSVDITGTGDVLVLRKSNNVPALAFIGTSTNKSVIEGGDNFNFYTLGVSRLYITSGGNVGIGTTSPSFKLDILSSGANTRFNSVDANGSYLVFANNGTAKAYIGSAYHLFGSPYNVANDLGIRSDWAMSFSTGGTPVRMHITSGGNVLIGTTTDAGNRLEVTGTGNNWAGSFTGSTTTGQSYGAIVRGGTNSSDVAFSVNNAANSTTYFRVRGDGNVGIGTTSPFSKLHVANTNSDFLVFDQFTKGVNNIGNGWKSIFADQTDSAAIGVNNSNLIFYNATDSTERMRVTTNGELLIGRTSGYSAGWLLAVEGNIYAKAELRADLRITTPKVLINTTTDAGFDLDVNGSQAIRAMSGAALSLIGNETLNSPWGVTWRTGTYSGGVAAIRVSRIGASDASNMMFFTSPNGDIPNERMRITSGGQILMGTTSAQSGARLQVAGGFLDVWSSANTLLRLRHDGTRGIIETFTGGAYGVTSIAPDGGNVLIGTTTDAGAKLRVIGNNISGAGSFSFGNASNLNVLNLDAPNFTLGINASNGGACENVRFYNGGTTVGTISTTGSLTSYNITSDYRLKQDFKPFNGLDLVSKIKVYDYEWKSDNSRMNGVIAHELQEVVPYAVTGEKDAEQMQSVDYSKLVPILVQAIQELKAEIEILKQNK